MPGHIEQRATQCRLTPGDRCHTIDAGSRGFRKRAWVDGLATSTPDKFGQWITYHGKARVTWAEYDAGGHTKRVQTGSSATGNEE
jgi:hypothetical protein